MEYGKRHHGKRGTGYRTGYGTGDLDGRSMYPSRHGDHLKSTPGNVAKPWEGSAGREQGDEMGLRSGCGGWRVNSACVSALTAGMRCLASRATLPCALGYSHSGRSQVWFSDCAAATLRQRISVGLNRSGSLVVEAAHLIVRGESIAVLRQTRGRGCESRHAVGINLQRCGGDAASIFPHKRGWKPRMAGVTI